MVTPHRFLAVLAVLLVAWSAHADDQNADLDEFEGGVTDLPPAVLEWTDEDFLDNLEKKEHSSVLVEVFSPNCGACKNAAPIYEEVGATLRESGITVVKINGKDNRNALHILGVMSYPSFFYIHDGRVVAQYSKEQERSANGLTTWVRDLYKLDAQTKLRLSLLMMSDKAAELEEKEKSGNMRKMFFAISGALLILCMGIAIGSTLQSCDDRSASRPPLSSDSDGAAGVDHTKEHRAHAKAHEKKKDK